MWAELKRQTNNCILKRLPSKMSELNLLVSCKVRGHFSDEDTSASPSSSSLIGWNVFAVLWYRDEGDLPTPRFTPSSGCSGCQFGDSNHATASGPGAHHIPSGVSTVSLSELNTSGRMHFNNPFRQPQSCTFQFHRALPSAVHLLHQNA